MKAAIDNGRYHIEDPPDPDLESFWFWTYVANSGFTQGLADRASTSGGRRIHRERASSMP